MGKEKFSTLVANNPATAKALNVAIGAPVNVKHYGAVGDGVTDDTAAFVAAETYCFNNGLTLFGEGTFLLTSKVSVRCNIMGGNRMILKNGITDTVTNDFLVVPAANVVVDSVKFAGENISCGAISISTTGVKILNCTIEDFDGNAIYDSGGSNEIIRNNIDNCGKTDLKHVIYLQSNSICKLNTISNSKYKAIISGLNSDGTIISENTINTTVGDAAVGIYASSSSQNIIISNNKISGTTGQAQSIKVSQSADGVVVSDNVCDHDIVIQGASNCKIKGNECVNIGDYSHTDAGGIPSRDNIILKNILSGNITIGTAGLDDIEGTKIIDNICANISGESNGRGFSIQNNTCERINFAFINAGTDETIIIKGNRVNNKTALVAAVDLSTVFGDTRTIVFSENTIHQDDATVKAVMINTLSHVYVYNNHIFGGLYSIVLRRISGRLLLYDNKAYGFANYGYRFEDSSSGTYWGGTHTVNLCKSNIGTFEDAANRRISIFKPESESLASSAPASGYHRVGDKYYNSAPSAGAYAGWVCITAGSPGTWKGFGLIEA